MGTQYKVDTDSLQTQIEALSTLLGEFPQKTFSKVVSDMDKGSTHEQINKAYACMEQVQIQLASLIQSSRDFFQKYYDAIVGDDQACVVTAYGRLTSTDSIMRKYDQLGVHLDPARVDAIIRSAESEEQLKREIEELCSKAKNEIIRKYENHERNDTRSLDRPYYYCNSAGTRVGYYVPENGCTWYAAARYRQVNGSHNDLVFTTGGGNADSFDDRIDRERFSVVDTRTNLHADGDYNYQAIRCNSIAVSDAKLSFDYSKDFTSANHVAYIEAVIDGYVYYTEGAYPNPESSFGYMRRATLDDFCRTFEHIISAR